MVPMAQATQVGCKLKVTRQGRHGFDTAACTHSCSAAASTELGAEFDIYDCFALVMYTTTGYY